MINQDRLIQTFFDLVKIDSPTGGEKQVAEYVIAKLQAIGATTTMDAMFNVTAYFPGKGKPILLSSHMDSVAPCHGIKPKIENGIITSSGDTILGGDDRVGVASILEALTAAHESSTLHLPVELAITAQEEPGLYGSRAMNLEPFKAKWGVVFDSDGPVGTIIIQAPGTNNFDVTIKGRAAHAGAEPEKGINAIAVASEAIAAMNLGRLDSETTANVGLIQGGAARNVVPEMCEVKLETRSFRPTKLERQTKHMVRALERAAKKYRAQADIKVHHPYDSFRLTKNDAIVQHVSEAVTRIGRTPKLGVTGGGSDGNIFNAHGIACVVVSIGIEKMHSTSEFIPVEELYKCGELAFELVKA